MPTLEEIMAQTHQKPKGQTLEEISARPPAMRVEPLDPLTGRARTAGKTMSEGETLDYALQTIPTVGAMIATAPISGPTGAAASGIGALIRVAAIRSLAAGAGGAAGSLIESSIQSGMGTPGAPPNKADVINRALGAGASQAGYQGVMEGMGVIPPLTVVAGRKFLKQLPKEPGAVRYLRGKWDEVKAAADARRVDADAVANAAVEDFRTAIQPHEVGETVQDAAQLMRKRFLAKESAGYGSIEAGMQPAKIDYTDVADRLIKLEKDRPKAKGGLSVMTEADAAWEKLVEAMSAGQKGKLIKMHEGAPGSIDLATGEVIDPGLPGRIRFEKAANSAERGDAVVRARSTISQRLWAVEHGQAGLNMAEGSTKEYVKGLRDLLGSLDEKIIAAAHEIDPMMAEGYRELLKFSGSNREIMKSALFKMAEENKGDVAKVLLSSRHPENVNLFMEIAKGGKLKPDDVAAIQRAGVESMLLRTKGAEKVIDLESFAPRLAQTGEAGKRLFADPKSKALVDNLAALSKEVKALPKRPGDVGLDVVEANESKLMELVAASAGFKLTNLVFLPREGYRLLTKQLMKIADQPAKYKAFHDIWRAYQQGALVGPVAAKRTMNLFRAGQVGATAMDLKDLNELAPSR
jgi:hypothetical protein